MLTGPMGVLLDEFHPYAHGVLLRATVELLNDTADTGVELLQVELLADTGPTGVDEETTELLLPHPYGARLLELTDTGPTGVEELLTGPYAGALPP